MVVRRSSLVPIVVAALLVGSGALAQQGLIVEPWSRAPRRAEDPARLVPVAPPAPRVMPASGLSPVDTTAALKVREALRAAPPAPPWKPPVVALLVDPWASSGRALGAAPRRQSVPLAADIVDPWASKPRSPDPAAPKTLAPHSTIF